MFSTVQKVRDEAWFTGNTNIADSYILTYQKRWYWITTSYVSSVYNLNDLAWVNFVWSQASDMLETAETLIGAWLLLIDQYWNNDLWWQKTGWDRLKEWKDLLMSITTGDMRLIWNDWEEFERKSKTTSGSIWVNDSAIVSWENKFSVSDQY
jgi:hypothetical protein